MSEPNPVHFVARLDRYVQFLLLIAAWHNSRKGSAVNAKVSIQNVKLNAHFGLVYQFTTTFRLHVQ